MQPDGSLVLRFNLDYETTPSYSLTISASDDGFPRLSGTAVLVINLLDVNDNAPVFLTTTTMFNTPEVRTCVLGWSVKSWYA